MGILSRPIATPLPDPVRLAQKREFRPGTDSRDRQIGKDEFDKGVSAGTREFAGKNLYRLRIQSATPIEPLSVDAIRVDGFDDRFAPDRA
jgi:hypothetical protein